MGVRVLLEDCLVGFSENGQVSVDGDVVESKVEVLSKGSSIPQKNSGGFAGGS